MKNIQQMIQTVEGPEGRQAISELVALGMPAFDAVVDAIRQSPKQTAGKLGDVIRRFRLPEVVPSLIQLLAERKIGLAIAAFRALGTSKDPRAFQPLMDIVASSKTIETRRALAADALGDLGDARAAPALIGVVDEAVKNELLYLALSAIRALAKLGNHDKAPAVIAIAGKRKMSVTPMAIETFQYAVCSGMLAVLQTAQKNRNAEVRVNAINALYYLGTKSSIRLLPLSAGDKDPMVATLARNRINGIVGDVIGDDDKAKKIRAWLDAHDSEFQDGVCYRLGKPISIGDIIELLEEPNSRTQVIQELRIITGCDFDYDAEAAEKDQEVLSRARRWWKLNVGKFEVGRLYKWGNKVDLSIVS